MAVKNLDALLKRFRAIPEAARVAVMASMDESADQMVAAMKLLAPEREGTLAASIRSERRSPISISVLAGDETTEVQGPGYKLQNAALQEYGTKRAPAQPFFGPVVRSQRSLAQRRLRAAAVKAVKKAWGV